MAEGFECDRCGYTAGGAPDTSLTVGPGRQRYRRSLGQPNDYEATDDYAKRREFDLCRGCMNDLRSWFALAGGDAAAIDHADTTEDSDE